MHVNAATRSKGLEIVHAKRGDKTMANSSRENKLKGILRKSERISASALIAVMAAAYSHPGINAAKKHDASSATMVTCSMQIAGDVITDLFMPLNRPWTVLEESRYSNTASSLPIMSAPIMSAYAYNGTSFIRYSPSGVNLEKEKVGKYPPGGKFNVPVLSGTPLYFIGIFSKALSPAQIKAYGKDTVPNMIKMKQADLKYKWPNPSLKPTIQHCESSFRSIPGIFLMVLPDSSKNKIIFSVVRPSSSTNEFQQFHPAADPEEAQQGRRQDNRAQAKIVSKAFHKLS